MSTASTRKVRWWLHWRILVLPHQLAIGVDRWRIQSQVDLSGVSSESEGVRWFCRTSISSLDCTLSSCAQPTASTGEFWCLHQDSKFFSRLTLWWQVLAPGLRVLVVQQRSYYFKGRHCSILLVHYFDAHWGILVLHSSARWAFFLGVFSSRFLLLDVVDFLHVF
jgi:hypothetical protein